jgi:hypothetical protein
VPQLLVTGGGITVGVAMKAGAAVRGGVTAGAHDGLQLRAQFNSIHACAAPVHCPCAAQAAHVACESVPEQAVAVAGRGAVVGTGRGAAVGGAVTAEQQLPAQFENIHACAAPVHRPCAAHVVHIACESAPEPEQRVVAATETRTGADVRGVATAMGAGVVAHDGLQLRAQFASIHACAAPLHSPCAAHAVQAACESAPEHEVVIAGRGVVGAPVTARGADVAMADTAVTGGAAAGSSAEHAGAPATKRIASQDTDRATRSIEEATCGTYSAQRPTCIGKRRVPRSATRRYERKVEDTWVGLTAQIKNPGKYSCVVRAAPFAARSIKWMCRIGLHANPEQEQRRAVL